MSQRKRKKNTRQRGSHTYGWGSKKKHRGAGNRGGRGFAGTGKRADHMKPMFWEEDYFGSKGFVSKTGTTRDNYRAINFLVLQNHIDGFVKDGKAKLSGNTYEVDLGNLGYDILLSKGPVTKKLKIKVTKVSENAVKKIQAFGGSVELTSLKKKFDQENLEKSQAHKNQTNKNRAIKAEEKNNVQNQSKNEMKEVKKEVKPAPAKK